MQQAELTIIVEPFILLRFERMNPHNTSCNQLFLSHMVVVSCAMDPSLMEQYANILNLEVHCPKRIPFIALNDPTPKFFFNGYQPHLGH